MSDAAELAAVDLGSNSFRMEIGRVVGTQIYTLDSLREPVRLASGLNRDKLLSRESMQRGLDALERFGERLRGLDRENVRAVATNTLRVARNAPEFLNRAEQLLGVPIEVIGGREEARLIYFGVAHLQEPGASRRLVVDIGGGSTEIIVGTGYRPEVLESVYAGCVSYSMRFFPGELCTKGAFREAELAARRLFEVVSREIRRTGWQEAIGSSGTARALAELLEQNGFSDHGITIDGLERLKSALIRAGRTTDLRLAALKPDRIPVLPGGLAIMRAAFDELSIERMSVSDGALRTGVLYDLLGRARHEDMRDTTVREFMQRYGVDELQANRVGQLATALWQGLEAAPRAPRGPGHQATGELLAWSAQLHEIGLSISHNGYHKHGAYILSNADMPGFSRREQSTLAALVLGHTGKLAKMKGAATALPDWYPLICLRLAAVAYRSRSVEAAPPLRLYQDRSRLVIELPRPWLEANPLTDYDLRQEIEELVRFGIHVDLATPP
jgi:exopolyphosphatase/guanosine-5'-triphosphate,3'-diphosphate pyrophosphatase